VFEYNKTVDLTAGDGRAKKLNETCFGGQEKKDQETKHNFF